MARYRTSKADRGRNVGDGFEPSTAHEKRPAKPGRGLSLADRLRAISACAVPAFPADRLERERKLWSDRPPGSDLIYLIHRYYDPESGQFLAVDPAVEATGAPYVYAGDNPVIATDPAGACPASGLSYGVNLGLSGLVDDAIPFPPDTFPPISIPKLSATGIGAAAIAVAVAASGGAQPTKQQMLYRFGFAWESAGLLEQYASEAQAAGFPHGVSVLSKLPPGRSASVAVRADVEAHFPVIKTGSNPYHYTVVLPQPVTETDQGSSTHSSDG